MKPNAQFDESDDSPKVSFLKEFSPKRSFVYCYFIEKKYSEKSPKKSEEKKVLYGINFASDIQRFYYYPETKDIYTFLGFKNQNQLEVAIFQPSLRNAALNRQFYYFPLQDLPSYLTPPVSENIKIDETSKKFVSLKQANRKKASLFIFLEYFKPIDGLFYCYFEEKNTPSGFVSSIRLNNFTFAPQTVIDIQRFVCHPESQKVFTFFGFLTRMQMIDATRNQKLQSSVKNKEIFIYKKQESLTNVRNTINSINLNMLNQNLSNSSINNNNDDDDSYYLKYQERTFQGTFFLGCKYIHNINTKDIIRREIQNLRNSSNFQNFKPKANLVYLYFIEKTFPCQNSFENIGVVNCLSNCLDIQLFCIYPHSKVVCSFFGFSNYHDLINNFSRLSYITLFEVYPYFCLSNKIADDKDLDDSCIHEFVPKKDLIYFYFHENKTKSNENKNAWCNLYQSPYAIYTAEDIQSSCYFPGTKQIYSFYGFKSKRLLLKAIKHSSFEFKDIYNLNIYDKKEKNGPSNQLIKNFLICSLCLDPERYKTQFSKSIKKFYPVEKLFYAYFKEDSEQFNNYKSLFNDINIVNIQRYRIYNGKIYSFVGFNDESKRNEFIVAHKDLMIEFQCYTEKICNNNEQNTEEEYFTYLVNYYRKPLQEKTTNNDVINKNAQKINESNLDESIYPTFEPKVNTFYLYFEEKAPPNKKLSDKNYQTIFGINFANDIQRFHYLPQTNKIFTFIGFSKRNDLNKAQNIQSLKSSSINQQINIFNTQAQAQTKSKSKSPKSKTKANNNKAEQNSRDKVINKSNKQTTKNPNRTNNDKSNYSSAKSQDKDNFNSNAQQITNKSKSNNDQLIFSPKKITNSNQQVNNNQLNTVNDDFHYSIVKLQDKNNSISNAKQITDKSKSNNDKFNYSPEKNISRSDAQVIVNKSEPKNDQLVFSPKANSDQIKSKNFEIVDSKKIISSNKTIDFGDQKQISNSNKSIYPTFEPKVNTFYLYFEEKAPPNKKLSDKNYQTIFGINFANDIQRFHYLPQTNKIFTFIGFSKRNDLNKAQNIQSLKSSSINQQINIFNTQAQAQTKSKSKSPKSKTETNISNDNNDNDKHEQNTRDEIINKSNEQVNINQYNSKNDNFHYSPTKASDKNIHSSDEQEITDKSKSQSNTKSNSNQQINSSNDNFSYSPEKISDKNTSIVNAQEITDKSKSKSNYDQLNFSGQLNANDDDLICSLIKTPNKNNQLNVTDIVNHQNEEIQIDFDSSNNENKKYTNEANEIESIQIFNIDDDEDDDDDDDDNDYDDNYGDDDD